jgi:hypothetical protein
MPWWVGVSQGGEAMKLAIAQVVLGALIVADFLSFGLLSGIEAGAFPPGWWKVFYFHNFLGFFVLGLAVLGCGIAQLLRARLRVG